jgi:hypothetical protein
MRVGLLQEKHGDEPGGLALVLRHWAGQPAFSHWVLESFCPLTGAATGEAAGRRPDVLVCSERLLPGGTWLEDWLGSGVPMVLATGVPLSETFRVLAEQFPVFWVPLDPTPETLGLAVLGALASGRRHLHCKTQIEQLQQRLNDRILIERAKGILVQRLGISEEEAYKRLRVLSRRQRRQIRDIAQSLLDTQSLLTPEANGFHPGPSDPPEPKRSLPPAERGGERSPT